VILLENSSEWNLSAKEGYSKKREEQGLKSKKVKPHFKRSMFQKKGREKKDKIYKLLGEILSKERKKGDHIFL
jgi:hypothetical protein